MTNQPPALKVGDVLTYLAWESDGIPETTRTITQFMFEHDPILDWDWVKSVTRDNVVIWER